MTLFFSKGMPTSSLQSAIHFSESGQHYWVIKTKSKNKYISMGISVSIFHSGYYISNWRFLSFAYCPEYFILTFKTQLAQETQIQHNSTTASPTSWLVLQSSHKWMSWQNIQFYQLSLLFVFFLSSPLYLWRRLVSTKNKTKHKCANHWQLSLVKWQWSWTDQDRMFRCFPLPHSQVISTALFDLGSFHRRYITI